MAITLSLSLTSLGTLDQVQHLHELDSFEPARFAVALEADLGTSDETLATLGVQLDGLHEALLAVEQFTCKAMAIRLTHVLAAQPLPPQLRTLLSSTVVSYASDITLLRRRFSSSISAAVLDTIIAAAEQVLTLRQALRDSILDLGRRVAVAQTPWLHKAARNGSLQDAERLRLRLARLDLHKLVEQPERLAADRFEMRLKKLPLPEEEREVEDEIDAKGRRFSLLEID